MIKGINFTWITIFLTLLLGSCTKETLVDTPSEGTSLHIRVRSALYPGDPDNKITGLRIMAFDKTFQTVRSNKYYNQSQLSELLTHVMSAGIYDFVFIANEPRDGITDAALNRINNKSQLSSIYFPASRISESLDIPMFSEEDDVTVLDGNQGVKINDVLYTIWVVPLERVAARFDFTLYATSGVYSDFLGVTFANIPDSVPLMGSYSGAHNNRRKYTVAANPSYFTQTTYPGAAWAVKMSRIILPSNFFMPENQSSKAIAMSVQLSGSPGDPTCTLGLDEANGDYTMPRNQYMQITGNVKYPIELNITPYDWGSVAVGGNIRDNRTLNISTTIAKDNELNVTRVYFTANQLNVYLEPVGYIGTSGNTPFNVNDVYSDVAGPNAANLHYLRGTYVGYIDIYADATPPFNSARVYLNAGGLRREITIYSSYKERPNWADRKFIGTFHRWNQIGERIIALNHTGPWTAQLDYPSGQSPFAVLSTERSFDPGLCTDTPGNAEDFQVANGVQSVSGNGNIYFRVGLTSRLSTSNSAPRYARIKVDYNGGTSYIYVRQGEEADYIMRPSDPINSEIVQSTRPKAVKFSPYNLTDPQKVIGKVDRGSRGYVFTDYPSQSGYLFQWSQTQAWSPAANAVGWVQEGSVTPWDLNPTWETCPPGYRRYNDGTTSDYVTNYNSPSIIADSEVRQSLWLQPVSGSRVNVNNAVLGYYADGFFDRRRIEDNTVGAHIDNYIVGKNADVAFAGFIHYNPTTYASLFMPNGIELNYISGAVQDFPEGAYHSSTTAQTGRSILTCIFDEDIFGILTPYYPMGGNIRCVAQ